jgi:hypothetical protein
MRIEDPRLGLAILRHRGCPACRAAGAAELRSIRWFLRETYGEPSTMKALLTKQVCVRHAWPMLTGDNAHLSRTFEYLVKARLAEPAQPRSRGLFSRKREPSADARPCMICEQGEHAGTVAVWNVLKALRSDEGRTAYAGHDGLCLPHHREAARRADPWLAEWLEDDLRRRLERLLELFDLYDRHRDVRFQHEPKGEEQEAWRWALRLFWGDLPTLVQPED